MNGLIAEGNTEWDGGERLMVLGGERKRRTKEDTRPIFRSLGHSLTRTGKNGHLPNHITIQGNISLLK
jgi:hypothetical protein